MTPRIGTLDLRLRAHGTVTGVRAGRLERVLAGEVAEPLARFLEEALDDGRSVAVLRRVRARWRPGDLDARDDAALGRAWAGHLARAVCRTAGGAEARGDLVRFESQATFVARFVEELLGGRAFDLWWFGAFGHLRDLDRERALERVLQENRDHLLAVLAELERRGVLGEVLDVLSLRAVDDLERASRGLAPAAEDRHRPLVVAALRLAAELGWAAPGGDADARELLARVTGAGGVADAERPPDWGDPADLARLVAGIVEQLVLERGGPRVLDAARLEGVLGDARFAWLDRGVLSAALRRTARAPAARVSSESRAPLPLSPRLSRLFADLAVALRSLSPAELVGGGAATHLRVVARLVANEPRWAEVDLAPDLVRRFLEAVVVLARSGAAERVLSAWSRGDVGAARAALASLDPGPAASAALRLLDSSVSAAPELATPLRDALEGAHAHARPAAVEEEIETDQAGLFLLARAVLDTGLASWAPSVGPGGGGAGALFVALGARWAGVDLQGAERIPDGLVRFAGADAPTTVAALGDLVAGRGAEWSRSIQSSLLACLAGLRAVRGTELALVAAERRGALVVVDRSTGTPVLAAPRRDLDGGALREVTAALGRAPELVTADDGERELVEAAGLAAAAPDDLHREHAARLDAALADLAPAHVAGDEVELPLDVVAIALVRSWARWLRGLNGASCPWLLERLVRRAGRVRFGGTIAVRLEGRAEDVVLRRAGYFDDLDSVPWLGGAGLRFEAR